MQRQSTAADQLIGDPTEGALLVLAAKGGIKEEAAARRLPRIAEIPFDSATKLIATFHQEGNQVHLFVKGAPDVLLERSARWLEAGGEMPLTEAMRTQLSAENAALAAQAMRVLAIASRRLPAQDFAPGQDLIAYVQDLTFIGLVGIIDPPHPEACEAIQLCHQAGITVKMITGDHKVTASACCTGTWAGRRGARWCRAGEDRCEAASRPHRAGCGLRPRGS